MDGQRRNRTGCEPGNRHASETVIVVGPICGAVDAFVHRAPGAQCARNEWEVRRVAGSRDVSIVCGVDRDAAACIASRSSEVRRVNQCRTRTIELRYKRVAVKSAPTVWLNRI